MDAHTVPMPDDASWLDGVVVPDDLRELHTDIEAYHREVRQAARRRRFTRITRTPAWQRLALPMTVAVGSLAVAGAVLAILTLGHPGPITGPSSAPIATTPAAAIGQVGGLLPDVTVRGDTGAMNVRDIRPALVALVPLHCDCTSLLSKIAGQAAEVSIPLVVVAPSTTDAEVAALPGQIHNSSVSALFDLHGELAAAYSATGVTVLGVRPDATVSFVQPDVDATVHLELPLQQMVGPTASLSST
jgi:hypothetical protein